MKNLNVFVPLTKVDVAQRLVYGVATAEKVDRSGEICDYASTKPFYEKWSGDIKKSTDGKSLGNVRAMHGKAAIGKLVDIKFNDPERQIEVCAKIVDDGEWKKFEEGIYTGFSHGGRYVKRWEDDAQKGVFRYTAEPSELSAVDIPCLPEAVFTLVRANGATELRKFSPPPVSEPTHNEIAERAQELAKAAGEEANWLDYLEHSRVSLNDERAEALVKAAKANAEDDSAGSDVIAPAFICKRDNSVHETAEVAEAHLRKITAADAVSSVAAPAFAAIADINKALDGDAPGDASPAAGDVVKGLYSVSRLADLLGSLQWLMESEKYDAALEVGSAAGLDGIKSACVLLFDALTRMVAAEAAELTASDDEMAAAAGMREGALDALVKFATETPALTKCLHDIEKLGARNSKKDAESLQKAHDALVSAGATCTAVEKAAAAEDLRKSNERADTLQKALDTLTTDLTKLSERIHSMEKRTMPLKTAGSFASPVSKSEDAVGATSEKKLSEDDLAKALAELSPEDQALLLTKAALSVPVRIER